MARVRAALAGERATPGWAQRVPPDGFPDPGAPSAVLAAAFEEEGEARVVLTRRSAHLRSHRGEVSFPGGRLDGEETAEEGALREAAEEIGLDPGSGRGGGAVVGRHHLRLGELHHPGGGAPRPAGPGWWPAPGGGARLRRVPGRTGRSGDLPGGVVAGGRARLSGSGASLFRSGSSSFPTTPSGAPRPGCSSTCCVSSSTSDHTGVERESSVIAAGASAGGR